MAHDVFVSHSAKDKPTADAVCAMLESQGIRCWVAPRDIVPGKDWGESIVDAIKGARVMVLIFSAHANDSHQIKREVERAVNKGIPVIPLRIEDVTPTKALEYFLSTPHWLDAFTPPLEKHLEYLAQIIGQIVGGAHLEILSAPTAEREGKKKSETADAAKLKSPATTAQRVADSKPKKEKTGKTVWIVAGSSVVIFALLFLILGGWFGAKPQHLESAQRRIQAGSKPQTNTSAVATNAMATTPLIPEEARKHFVMGTTLFKDAKTADDFLQVESEFKQAADLAPQWPEPRYNLALAREAAADYSGAIDDWKLYQSFKLPDTEARTVQDKIYALEAKQQVKEMDEKKAAEEKAQAEAEAARQAEEKRKADELAAQKAAEEKKAQEIAAKQAADEKAKADAEAARLAEEKRQADELAAQKAAEEKAKAQRAGQDFVGKWDFLHSGNTSSIKTGGTVSQITYQEYTYEFKMSASGELMLAHFANEYITTFIGGFINGQSVTSETTYPPGESHTHIVGGGGGGLFSVRTVDTPVTVSFNMQYLPGKNMVSIAENITAGSGLFAAHNNSQTLLVLDKTKSKLVVFMVVPNNKLDTYQKAAPLNSNMYITDKDQITDDLIDRVIQSHMLSDADGSVGSPTYAMKVNQ